MISNFGGKGAFSSTVIADIILEKVLTVEETDPPVFIDASQEELQSLEGLYMADDYSDWVELSIVDDTLTVDGRNRLAPISKDEFYVLDRDKTVRVIEPEKTTLVFSDNEKINYVRNEEWKPTPVELKEFKGDYWSEELEGVYHLGIESGVLSLTHRWLDTIRLEPIARDFFATDWGYVLRFRRDKQGNISGFFIDSYRTKNVQFDRIRR